MSTTPRCPRSPIAHLDTVLRNLLSHPRPPRMHSTSIFRSPAAKWCQMPVTHMRASSRTECTPEPAPQGGLAPATCLRMASYSLSVCTSCSVSRYSCSAWHHTRGLLHVHVHVQSIPPTVTASRPACSDTTMRPNLLWPYLLWPYLLWPYLLWPRLLGDHHEAVGGGRAWAQGAQQLEPRK